MTSKLISFIRRKVFRIDKYRWDYQYAKGQWDSLRTDEMQRIYVARDFLNRYAMGGNILEIGCGEGIFFQNTLDVDYNFYEGIDLSELAISRVEKKGKSLFLAADMEKYVPTHHPFSIIVLNEVLYYSKNPTELLKRYTRYLTNDGVFLIGMNDAKKSTEIWNSISNTFSEIDSVKVQQDTKAWYYKIFKMK